MGNKTSKPSGQQPITLHSVIAQHDASTSAGVGSPSGGSSFRLSHPGADMSLSVTSMDALFRSRGTSTATNASSRRSFAGGQGYTPVTFGLMDAGAALGMPVGGPVKYLADSSGVRRLNPAYVADPSVACTIPNSIDVTVALPVLSSLAERAQHLPTSQLAATVTATVAAFEHPEVATEVQLPGRETMRRFGAMFEKYHAPMGLLNKLTLFTEWDAVEFIIDDSGSMRFPGLEGPPGTRWEELQLRLKQMLEILAHVPLPPITIRFLNVTKVVLIARKPEETPRELVQRCMAKVDKHLGKMTPRRGTPAFEAISESLERNPGKAVARYFFGDGCPKGGARGELGITRLLTLRANPHRNPFTFVSFTPDLIETKWMKDAAASAPFCASYDSLAVKAADVRAMHGAAFPYTMGVYLIGQLVGVLCPDDLAALDESVPLTKTTLQNILGYQVSPAEYKHYFDHFIAAQQRLRVSTPLDSIRRRMDWARLHATFMLTPLARNIPEVMEYKHHLEVAARV
jgi:hypothetical protein